MAIIDGTPGPDTLNGTALDDEINGLGADDTLRGFAGKDKVDGGTGNDTLEGGTENDTLIGGLGNDYLIGGDGDDQMTGGVGNDAYVVLQAGDTVIELPGQGTDSIVTELNNLSLAAFDNVEILGLVGTSSLNASGSDRSDILNGNTAPNTLTGGKGGDTINGGGGIDQLNGGAGNDTYFVDDTKDDIVEFVGEGKDSVFATVSYRLAAGREIEDLTLQGTDKIDGVGNDIGNIITGNAADNNLSGLAGNDKLIGGEGNDRLDGGSGGDAMIGGKGGDVYIVDNAADTMTEAVGEGVDTVMQRVADLTLAANVEAVFLETGAVNAIGNTARQFHRAATASATSWTADSATTG